MQRSVDAVRALKHDQLVLNGRRMRRVATLLIATGLAGCAATYEGKYSTSEGWHPAKVIEIGTADKLTQPVFKDCRKEIPGQTGAQPDRYAMVSYSWLRSRRSTIVPLAADSVVKTGDPVYVNLQDCSKPLMRQANS